MDVSAINPDQISAIFNYRTMYEAGKTLYNTTIDAPAEVEILSVSPETFRLQLQRRED